MGSEVDEPHIIVGGSGKSLEIFLFSNGQQDSPPRKYNLRANERWNATLNFLARSQYGTKQTIELYTIDGKKIEGPLELADGAAYVAVEPPQVFASAGYHEYLMKASRSREKRQERITEKESLIKTVKMNIDDINEEDNKDTTNIKMKEDWTIVSTDAIAAEEHDAITDKLKSDIAKAVKPIRRISTVKQPPKRNSYLPQQNPSVIRKNISNITPPIKRGNNNSKRDVIKKKFELPSIKSTKNTITSTIHSKSKSEKAGGVRPTSYNRDQTKSRDLQEEADLASMPDRTFAGLKAKQKLTVDSSTTTATPVVIERRILLPVSVNCDKDHGESELIYLNKRLSSATTLYNRKNGVAIPNINENITSNPRDIINSSPLAANPYVGPAKAKVITKVSEEFSQNETLIFGRPTGDNNFAIYVKKGDVVNLKLNIEVKNGSSAVIETNESDHLKASASVMSNPKSDRGTLADNTAVANSDREAQALTEPGLAGLPFEQLQQITNELKVAVCGISCCPCPGNPERAAPVYVDNNNYIILLPPDTIHENSLSCTCKLEINQKSKSDIPDHQVLPRAKSNNVTLDQDKNVPINAISGTTVTENDKNATNLSAPTENQLLSKNVSIVEIEVNQICACCETCKIQNLPPVCNCAQRLILECPACANEQPISTALVEEQHARNNNFNIFKEAFTQTVWSSVVLEARPRGDGSYAFHLPSLEILKLCNVLY